MFAEKFVPINLPYVKEAKIGQAVMDADVFISLTHFKVMRWLDL